jgi:hypothetical protein
VRRRLTSNALEAVVTAAAAAVTFWLAGELRDPYSDLRLKLSEIVDRVKGAST